MTEQDQLKPGATESFRSASAASSSPPAGSSESHSEWREVWLHYAQELVDLSDDCIGLAEDLAGCRRDQHQARAFFARGIAAPSLGSGFELTDQLILVIDVHAPDKRSSNQSITPTAAG